MDEGKSCINKTYYDYETESCELVGLPGTLSGLLFAGEDDGVRCHQSDWNLSVDAETEGALQLTRSDLLSASAFPIIRTKPNESHFEPSLVYDN